MKFSLFLFAFLSLILIAGCNVPKQSFTDNEKETIKKEVSEQFSKIINAVNQKNETEWASFYSTDEFISASAGHMYFTTRDSWVDSISTYFKSRESQKIYVNDVKITPLSQDLALLTSSNKAEMVINKTLMKSQHLYSMLWKKEKDGWKIIHQHESWLDE